MAQPPSSALEHGYFVMAREGKIVRISVAEGINKELIQHYQQDIARELARLAGSHWGVHLVLNGDVLMTPAATDRLIQESKQHKDLGSLWHRHRAGQLPGNPPYPALLGQSLSAGRRSLLLCQQPARGRGLVTGTDSDSRLTRR